MFCVDVCICGLWEWLVGLLNVWLCLGFSWSGLWCYYKVWFVLVVLCEAGLGLGWCWCGLLVLSVGCLFIGLAVFLNVFCCCVVV